MVTSEPLGRALRASPAVYFPSYGLSLLGKGIASVVVPLLVLDRTGDVLAVGVLATVSTAVSAATGLIAGLVVDRLDRLVASRETIGNTLILAGPGLGGLLIAVLGPTSALMLITAATRLLGVRVRRRCGRPASGTGVGPGRRAGPSCRPRA